MTTILSADELWKSVIEDYIEDFLWFFFPNLSLSIDFSKAPIFLDGELQRLAKGDDNTVRKTDRLVKVFLKDNSEKLVLIHIEVQSHYKNDFAKRMFIYYYRIFEIYGANITALALYTYKSSPLPNSYTVEFEGTKVQYSFNTFLLKDFNPSEHSMNNVFTYVLEHAYIHLFKKSELRYELTRKLMDKMIEHNYTIEAFRRLQFFILNFMHLKTREITHKFVQDLKRNKNYNHMGIIELMEHKAKLYAEEVTAKVAAKTEDRVTKEVTKEVTKKVTKKITESLNQQIKIDKDRRILKAIDKGLSNEIICDLFDVDEQYIKDIKKSDS